MSATASAAVEPISDTAGQSTAISPKPPLGSLVPQPHGGALRRGGTSRGGSGRPPSATRELLREGAHKNAAVLDDIAAGEIVQRMRVQLGPIASALTCPNCGELGLAAKTPRAGVQEIEVRASASPKERIMAIEAQLKYGLGALKEINAERVAEAVGATLEVIRRHVAPQLATEIIDEIRPLWTTRA